MAICVKIHNMCWQLSTPKEKEWFELSLDETLGNPKEKEWKEYIEDDRRIMEAFEPFRRDIEEEARNNEMENIKHTVWLSGGTLAVAATISFTHSEILGSFFSRGMVIGFGACLMMTFAQLWCGQRSLFFAHKTVSMSITLMKAVRLYGASVARGTIDEKESRDANVLWDKTRRYGKNMHWYAQTGKHLSTIIFIVFEFSMIALIAIILQFGMLHHVQP